MGFSGKRSGGGEGWGMGLFLVFFREENPIPSLKSPTIGTSLRTGRNPNLLLSRARSTISICALLIFITLLVFTLCTFEPSLSTPNPHLISLHRRRMLSQKSPNPMTHFRDPLASTTWFRWIWGHKLPDGANPNSLNPFALQGMGVLYRRGTEAMDDLAICHVSSEDVTEEELRLFLRLLHRSGLTSRSDLVLIFSATKSSFDTVIREENESFLKLVNRHGEPSNSALSFDATQFVKPGDNKSMEEHREPLWGKKSRENHSNSDKGRVEEEDNESHVTESTQLSYGSVVGFEADELDPENALAGFMDHVPMSLRRWACYQMLLGRVRRNIKRVVLVDVKNSLVTRDPLGRVRNKSPESVFLWTTKHGGRKRAPLLTPSVVMGGARGIRRFANSVLVEIVRSATQHKTKFAVSEPALLSQLAQNGFLLKNVDLEISAESIPEASSLGKLNSHHGSSPTWFHHGVILRGSKNRDLYSVFMKEICSYEHEISVYENCLLHI